jgi:hypothetical protein
MRIAQRFPRSQQSSLLGKIERRIPATLMEGSIDCPSAAFREGNRFFHVKRPVEIRIDIFLDPAYVPRRRRGRFRLQEVSAIVVGVDEKRDHERLLEVGQ